MGRNRKLGLDYFSMDVDFFQDIRIRKLIKYQGGKAVTVYALLLCIIYKQGYYVRWDDELPFIISEQTGFEEAYIQEVFKCCLIVGLFSKKLYDSDKVITSKGIQERWIKLTDYVGNDFLTSKLNLLGNDIKIPKYKLDHEGKRLFNINVKEWKRISKAVFKRDNYTCQYCGKVGGKLEVDHIFPFSKGGSDSLENLTTSCQKCNRQKRDKSVDDFLKWRDNHGKT
jgi:hypothetical protein|nr:MAG TPA: protein of unknown function DUF4373 [Caudoviricetes sp.]